MVDDDDRHWVSVADAAKLANRSPRAIYYWIEHDLIASRQNRSTGTLEVLWKAVVRTEPRRGRPRH